MTCPGSCLKSGQVMVLMTCWWEFFDSKHLSHLRPKACSACSNEIHEPKQTMSDVPNWFCPWVVFALPAGTVIIGEHGKFVPWWGSEHTVRIKKTRVPRDRYGRIARNSCYHDCDSCRLERPRFSNLVEELLCGLAVFDLTAHEVKNDGQ